MIAHTDDGSRCPGNVAARDELAAMIALDARLEDWAIPGPPTQPEGDPMSTDLHGMGGRTMSAGEAALRAKMRALYKVLLRSHDPHVCNAGQLISDVLTGELDPRSDEVRL